MRNLLCRIGWHAWYLDCALVASANKCIFCGKPENRAAAERLRLERERLDAAPKGAPLSRLYAIALGAKLHSMATELSKREPSP